MDPESGHAIELEHAHKDENHHINGEDGELDDDDAEGYSSEGTSSTCSSDEEDYIESEHPPHHMPTVYGRKPSPADVKLGVGHALVLSTIPRPPPPPPLPPPSPLPPLLPISRSKTVLPVQSLSDPKHFGPRKPTNIKNKEIILRCASATLSLVAFSIMVSAHETRTAAGSTFDVKFSYVQAYSYLVAFNVISVVYSSVQLIMLAQPSNISIFSSPTKLGLCIYICDQILACLLFSASSSAATASEIARHGLHNIWPPACSTWKLWYFCTRAEIAVVMSFFASLFVMLSSLLSGYYLSRLLKE